MHVALQLVLYENIPADNFLTFLVKVLSQKASSPEAFSQSLSLVEITSLGITMPSSRTQSVLPLEPSSRSGWHTSYAHVCLH